MPKELAKASASFDDIRKRVDPMVLQLERLNNNFWNDTSGTWNRYYSGIDLLAERVKALGVGNASDPKAVNDRDVKSYITGITAAKADCMKISKEYWTTVSRVDGIVRELNSLVKSLAVVIKDKSEVLSRSKSVPALQALSVDVTRFINELQTMTKGQGPHRPDSNVMQAHP